MRIIMSCLPDIMYIAMKQKNMACLKSLKEGRII